MFLAMAEVWIFEVEHPDGALLFAAGDPDPIAAEALLRSVANFQSDREVLLVRPDDENRFGLKRGEIRGPF